MGPIAVFLAAGVLLAGSAVLYGRHAAQDRTATLKALAARMGWGFREEVPFDTIPDLRRFELFRQGRRRTLRNLMTSPAGDLRAVLFDYTYTTGGGNSQQTHRQTLYYATSDELSLPSFSLRPENFFHRVANALGYRDINFAHRPEFSRMFLLRGENETHVRAAFDSGITEFFETRPGVCAAGGGREVLLWRAGGYAKPEEIEALIMDGADLARRLGAL